MSWSHLDRVVHIVGIIEQHKRLNLRFQVNCISSLVGSVEVARSSHIHSRLLAKIVEGSIEIVLSA